MANVTSLGKYRLDLLQHAKLEMGKTPDQQEGDDKLFEVAIKSRIKTIVLDMLQTPQINADYSDTLVGFMEVFAYLRDRGEQDNADETH